MSQLVENDPLVMDAVDELRRFSADPDLRELERRRKLWKLEYYSGLAAAEDKGKAVGKAEDVLRILARQHRTVPKSLADQVRVITDIEKLDELFDLAFDCKSLDEFAKHVPLDTSKGS